jgi:endonuclease G
MSSSKLTKVQLRVEVQNPLTEIRISDARFRDVKLPANVGPIDAWLAPGVYEVSFREGTSWRSELVLLGPESGSAPVVVHQPTPFPTDAPPPIPDAEEPDVTVPPAPATSRLTIRAWPLSGPNVTSSLLPVTGVEVLYADSESSVTPRDVTSTSPQLSFDLPPGYWRLRLTGPQSSGTVEMPLVMCPGWNTVVELALDSSVATSAPAWSPADLQMQMRRLSNMPRNTALREYRRLALQSLATRRSLQGAAFEGLLNELLTDKWDDPLLGIYGAYLLPFETTEQQSVASGVIQNLALLVQGPAGVLPQTGFRHPDVDALALRLSLSRNESLSSFEPFAYPPMLARGWRTLMEAARQRPDLVPKGSLTAEVAARLVAADPWVAWRQRPASSTGTSVATVTQGATAGQPAGAVGTTAPVASPTVAAPVAPAVAAPPALTLVTVAGAAVTAAAMVAGATARTFAQEGTAADVAPPVPDDAQRFAANCQIIRAALAHRSLREWYRRSVASAENAPLEAAVDPIIPSEERILAGALRPIATDEERQQIFDAAYVLSARPVPAPPTAENLARQTGLPVTTLADAAASLALRFLDVARAANIDLNARSIMAIPDLIIPYDANFLGDGFIVPPPAMSDALRLQAYAGGASIAYTHYSLVMHAVRRTAIFAASNIDASRKVQMAATGTWRMDERVGESQMGPEGRVEGGPDGGRIVRREDLLWGTVAEARSANAAASFYSNAAPQHMRFDRDEWVRLEEWALERAPDFCYRLCVLSGPVLRDNDPFPDKLPSNLQAMYRTYIGAQIPAAFWKVIVLRDASAAGEDLSATAFAMRQSDFWNDNDGRQLQSAKVHQVTLQAIEQWTGLDFGELKKADELQWSLQTAMPGLSVPLEWPQIRCSRDIVFSGQVRRRLGARVQRASAWTESPGLERLSKPTAGCGCEGTTEFDARAAVEALSKDFERLTAMLAAQAQALEAQVPAGTAGVRGIAAPVGAPAGVDAQEDDPRVIEIVSAAPLSTQKKMRVFARSIVEQGDVNRGTRRATAPRELERIIGGEDVPPGGYPSCVCIGDATRWFCSGALIGPRVVLTAGHCGAGITRIMVAGNRVSPWLDSAARVIAVQSVYLHPEYRAPSNENDINLLILAEQANLPPVPLASSAQLQSAEGIELVGFGYNDPSRPLGFGTKRQVHVPMAPILGLAPGENLTGLEAQLGFHSAYEFVAGRKGLGIDTCNGDSGGPAYLKDPTLGPLLAGLTSRATRSGTQPCGDGGIYVRPDVFASWIRDTLARAAIPWPV